MVCLSLVGWLIDDTDSSNSELLTSVASMEDEAILWSKDL